MNTTLATQIPTKMTAADVQRDLVLIVLSGKSRGFRLPLNDRIRIGKSGDNDLVLADETVSRHHCEILRSDAGLVVRDLGSTTYTKVGSSRVTEASLQPGVPLVVGDIELVVRAEPKRAPLAPSESSRYGDLVGPSLAMRTVFGMLDRLVHSDASVLLEGEAGTGKEAIARAIHANGTRRNEPFVVVDCATSCNLVESELFGCERGAFAGAATARAGAFEAAGRGTIFLEDVGDLPLEVQAKVVRVLEQNEFRRIGSTRPQKAMARVIASSKRKLTEEIERGRFREDLYLRVAAAPISVPPLRSRREDVPALIEWFLESARTRDPGLANVVLPAQVVTTLSDHDWPGNVRELKNIVERAVGAAAGNGESELTPLDVPASGVAPQPVLQFDSTKSYREVRASFEADFERRYVGWLLARHSGNISAAAREAKMDRKYLYDLARKHGLRGSKT